MQINFENDNKIKFKKSTIVFHNKTTDLLISIIRNKIKYTNEKIDKCSRNSMYNPCLDYGGTYCESCVKRQIIYTIDLHIYSIFNEIEIETKYKLISFLYNKLDLVKEESYYDDIILHITPLVDFLESYKDIIYNKSNIVNKDIFVKIYISNIYDIIKKKYIESLNIFDIKYYIKNEIKDIGDNIYTIARNWNKWSTNDIYSYIDSIFKICKIKLNFFTSDPQSESNMILNIPKYFKIYMLNKYKDILNISKYIPSDLFNISIYKEGEEDSLKDDISCEEVLNDNLFCLFV